MIASAIQMVSGSDIAVNLNDAVQLVKASVDAGAELVVLPEMFLMFGADNAVRRESFPISAQQEIVDTIAQWAIDYGCWIVAGTLPLTTRVDGSHIEGERSKAACGVVNGQGEWVAWYEKYHLFNASLLSGTERYQESDTFEPGREWVVFDSPWGRVGVAVCFDLRFAEMFLYFRQQGVQIVALPSAFTEITGSAHWEVLIRARAIEHQMFVVAANQGGEHPCGRKTWGQSMIVDGWGRVLAQKEKGPGLAVATLDFDGLTAVLGAIPMSRVPNSY